MAPTPTHPPAGPGGHPRTTGFGGNATSLQRLQDALTAGGAAAWCSDLHARERWWSPEMFALHGLAEGQAPDDYMAVVHPDDRELVAAALRDSVATGAHRVEYRVVWPDGSVHWLEGRGRTVLDAAGRPRTISGICTLVDARKEHEADLRFLMLASTELARSTDYEDTLRRVAALAVPHFADWCAVDMLDDAGELRRVAVAHVDPAKVALAQDLQRRYPPDRDAPAGAWKVIRSGRPELIPDIPREMLERTTRDAEHLAIVLSLGLRSSMSVPIVGAGGEVRGAVSFASSDSGRVYGAREFELAQDLVARAAVAIQNAELFDALQHSRSRQDLLLELTDILRGNGSTVQVLHEVSALLGRHFGVDRVGYGHVDEALDRIDYDVCWTDGTVPVLLGTFPASAFGPQVIERLRAGETIAIANVREHPYTSEQATIKTSHEVDTRAILVVPLFKAGRLRTIVYLNQGPARAWTAAEISLMEEVAERTRELIERGRAEEALRESEARWRGLFERMAEGFFVAEAMRDDHGAIVDFRFLQVNPAFEALTGVQPAVAVGRPVTEVIPGVPRGLIDRYARVVETGEPAEFEVQVPVLDDRWYEARASRLAPDQFTVLFIEITARKRAEQEAVRNLQRYRTLFESIDEGFCIIEMLHDADGHACDYRFLEINPAFERQSGLHGAVGRTIRELVPAIESSWIETYARVARTGESIRFDSHTSALGRWFDAFAFRVGEPAQHRVALLFTDITQRKRIEQELRAADERKNEFLATLAHELRNPLAPLRTGLAILDRVGPAGQDAARTRELMDRQLTHLVRLVDDLLDVSRVSQGKVVLKKSVHPLRAIVDLALETSQPLVEAARHELVVRLPAEPVLLLADATRIAQVLSNILNNAAKYTPDGGRIELRAQLDAASRVRLQVQDNGIGIPSGMLESVFDLFTQVGAAAGRSQGGLGIGLSLARRLVELHGGTVHAESAGAGRGCTFTVELPALSPGQAGVDLPPPAPGASTPRRDVLVVDDNTDAAETLAMVLELDGHGVRVAHGGRDALAAFDGAGVPDIVFLDIGLPDITGYDVAMQLRARAGLEHVVLVALTGWGAERDQQRAREAGFDLHLTKPVAAADVERALRVRRGLGVVAATVK